MRKGDRFLVIDTAPDNGREFETHAWDMLRYDTCYPVSIPDRYGSRFRVMKQDHQPNRSMGFTVDRWKSFGFRNVREFTARTTGGGLPYDLIDYLDGMVARSEVGV